ncbi:MAG: 2-hydroxyacid dehydrogenase [Actinomycetes bacterium]
MTLVWLPDDDWAQNLEVPSGLDVEVWRSGQDIPRSVAEVAFYVPEYMGPASILDVMSTMSSLRVVQTLTAGVDDVLTAIPHQVTLCNAAGVHDASTAELAVALAICSLRGIPGFIRAQDQGVWLHGRHDALADRRVVLLGAGSVGSAIAARLAPFEVDLQVVARTPREGVRGIDELPALLPTADVVILAIPYGPDTQHLVDAAFLAALPDAALVVNVARGAVVDTVALVAELNAGRLRAALDVTDPEPLPPGHPLWGAPNVIITPHVGGDTSAFLPRAWKLLQAQLDRFAVGAQLANVVRPGNT